MRQSVVGPFDLSAITANEATAMIVGMAERAESRLVSTPNLYIYQKCRDGWPDGTWQRMGIEWAWRLAAEPVRLSRRYVNQIPPAMLRLSM